MCSFSVGLYIPSDARGIRTIAAHNLKPAGKCEVKVGGIVAQKTDREVKATPRERATGHA